MKAKALLKIIVDRLSASNFLKSVLTLSSGVVVAQAINFLGMPVVGRLYDPAAIGDYTLITSNAAIISAVACLGMMTSFMLPAEDEEARGLSRLVTYSTVGITSAILTVLWVVRGSFRIFHTEQISYSLSLVVLWLYIVGNTISNICYAYVNRRKLYRIMFWNPIISTTINVGVSIVLGLLKWGFLGYTLAHILSYVATVIHLVHYANPYEKTTAAEYRILPLLRSYRRFPVYQMPANLISSLGRQLPVQMIEVIYSSHVLGMYSMAIKIMSLPVMLLATPVNRVFFQEASQRYSRGENIGEFAFHILRTNIKIAILPISILIIFGEWIFSLFLGPQWYEAGTFAAILGCWELLDFCAYCLSGSFALIRRNNIELGLAVAKLFMNVALYAICVFWVADAKIAITLLAGINCVYELIQRGIFLNLTNVPLRKYIMFVIQFILLPVGISWLIRMFFSI